MIGINGPFVKAGAVGREAQGRNLDNVTSQGAGWRKGRPHVLCDGKVLGGPGSVLRGRAPPPLLRAVFRNSHGKQTQNSFLL